jgi:radical SAM superfamily enzyme YgiQ (UPF0313 family)
MSRTTYKCGVEIARGVRARLGPAVRLLLGGYDCHYLRVAERKLAHLGLADHIVIGEGERAIAELLNGEHAGNLFIQSRSAEDLDDIAWPTYAEVDWGATPRRVLVMGSRGCPWSRCMICPDKFGGKYRARSGENIFAEIMYNYRNNGIRVVSFADPVFNGRKQSVLELCELIRASGVKDLEMDAQSSFIFDISAGYAASLKEAGFGYLFFGFESGSQRIVEDMNKGFRVENAARIMRTLHEAGIKVGINVLTGFPTETEADFEATQRFLVENSQYIHKVHENNHFRIYTDVSDCGLNSVAEDPLRYGVDPATVSEENWISQGGRLTLEVRKRRTREVNDLCDRLGILKSYKVS